MAIRRITISVTEDVARRLKKAAGRTPVSTWVTERLEEHLDDAELERQWQEFCRDAEPTRDESRRADAIFRKLTRTSRKGAA